MSHPDVAAALAAVDTHFDTFVEELQQLCRIRSLREEAGQMTATAEFLAGSLERWGGSAEIVPWADSHPYVLGEIGGGERALLHFNHYDVAVEPTGDDSVSSSARRRRSPRSRRCDDPSAQRFRRAPAVVHGAGTPDRRA